MPQNFAKSSFSFRSLVRGVELLYLDGGQVAAEWRAAHLASVLRVSPFTMAANVGSSLLVLWSFRDRLSSGLLAWAAAIVSMSLVTCLGAWRRRQVVRQQVSRRAFRRATWHACLLAGTWAMMPIAWFPHGTPEQQITIAALTTGMLSAGAFLLSPLPLASLAYGAIYAIAALVALLRTGDESLFGTVALMCIYAPTVLIGAMSSWHKSTTQLAVQGQIARRERLLGILLQDFEQSADEALWEIDPDGRLRHSSARLAEFLEASESDLRTLPFLVVLERASPAGAAALRDAFDAGRAFREIRFSVGAAGRLRHLTINGKWVFDEEGQPTGWRGVIADVTGKVESERRLVQLAHTDPLTGLANRLSLLETLATCLRDGGAGALLTLDLDHFKSINDGLGHVVGDEFLRAVATRLRESVAGHHLVVRLGGDEFAIVMHPLGDPAAAEALAATLIESMRRPFALHDHRLELGASVGIAHWEAADRTPEELLLQSDIALYHSKHLGRGRCSTYSADLGVKAQRRLMLEEGLREALDRGELALFWQPKVEIATNRIVGSEALMRWAHPQMGVIAPSEFIPLAEQCGLIHELGEWALREACRVGAQDMPELSVAVNVSTVQLLSGTLPALVRDVLATTGMAPARLELELTESVFLEEPEQALVQLEAIRALGVRIALDDFGTGYSSLAYLRKFPFSSLKVDRSFVVDMPTQHDARLMVNTIVLMADAMGLRTVCEGVESDEQLTAVTMAGCTDYQGYLASSPLPLDLFLSFVRGWHRRGGTSLAAASAGTIHAHWAPPASRPA